MKTGMVQIEWIFLTVALLAPGCDESENPPVNPVKPEPVEKVLVWSDEFSYTGLPDAAKWSFDTEGNAWKWGNNEAQYYTADRLKNAEVKDGFLHITAHREDYGGSAYTSARLRSKGKGDWLYGRIELRAKIPDGRGMWPAIWMLPTDWVYGDWPKSGEIDIMENVGYDPNIIVASAHTESYNHTLGTQKSGKARVQTCYTEFHVYALEWMGNEYKVYVDDLLIFTFRNEGKGYKVWPFDKRFHLLLNVAVGGNWGGVMGIDDSIFPRTMMVDYVRVYQ